METIKRFFECLLPVTACNLRCSYCYVIQRENRKMKLAELKYTPEQIGLALSEERLGGICYFSICGAGETTLQPELPEIVYNLLKHGHFVNITTNGTVTKQLEKLLYKNKAFVEHLHFAFSFHFLELKRLNMLDTFFANVKMVREAGASFLVQINLCDEYEPYLEKIKSLCLEKIGALPQVAATRKESSDLRKIEFLTSHTEEEYRSLGNGFDSPLFDFTMKNFNVRQRGFCYAGDWTGNLNLATGELRRCYCSYLYRQNIFEKPNKKIKWQAIGNHCGSPFCMNSSHFLSLGAIPEIDTPSYESLRNREKVNWYNNVAKEILTHKLSEANVPYGNLARFRSNVLGCWDSFIRISVHFAKNILRKN
ncbi:MAG: radical SAM protein [Treponema sp.]|nr:radical SAM protein [Treponema sp.]